ncbi:MAG: 50S ribosomal protein L34 [Planctomycetes bacterium]|nr:50S ribosomal protein L34 [Planctomycetota bacterium]
MKTNVRNSTLKGRTRHSFRRRMKTRSGRAIINRQRRLATGKGKKR